MNKLKVAVAALKEYLGRDMQGVRLLCDVEIIANQTRKDLASARENLQESLSLQEIARRTHIEELLKLERANEALRGERDALSQERARIVAVEKENNDLRDELERMRVNNADDSPDFYNNISEKSLEGLVKAVRSKMSKCPSPSAILPAPPTKEFDSYYSYNVLSIIRNFSTAEMLFLGRFVAVMAMMNTPCVITSSTTIKTISKRPNDDMPPVVRDFLKWWSRNNIRQTYGAKMGRAEVLADELTGTTVPSDRRGSGK